MAVEPVYLVPYDSRWPELFGHERDRIEAATGPRVEIDQVRTLGSYAQQPVSGVSLIIAVVARACTTRERRSWREAWWIS